MVKGDKVNRELAKPTKPARWRGPFFSPPLGCGSPTLAPFSNKWACQQAIGINKHFITLPKGNSEFCFTEAMPRRTLWSKGNKTHCFARDQTLSDLLFLPTQKYNKTVKKSFSWRRIAHKFTAVSRSTKVQAVFFLGSNWFLFPRELVTRSPPIGKRISAGKYNKPYCYISQLK